tara:strand:- start:59 stop:778 length:720 start_codon:yes stop_codon:yes gene_type:complete
MKQIIISLLLIVSLEAQVRPFHEAPPERPTLSILPCTGPEELEEELDALTQRLTGDMINMKYYHNYKITEPKLGEVAEYMLITSLSWPVDDVYILDSRIINIETGESVSSAQYDHEGNIEMVISTGVRSIAQQLCDLPGIKKTKDVETLVLEGPSDFKTILKNTLKINGLFGTDIDAKKVLVARMQGNYRYFLNLTVGRVCTERHWDNIPYFKKEVLIEASNLDMETLYVECLTYYQND